jgi:SAM-dependent methyltransferase
VRESVAFYDPAFFDWQSARAEQSARAVVPRLIELVQPRSVVDLGSGTGAWLQVFREHGIEDVMGIDGPYIDRSQLRIPAELFVGADLAAPPALDRRFDLAITLESVHCAPPESAETIVHALTTYAPVVYFSSAVPNQAGGPGPNRQWPRYWSDLFAREEYMCFDLLRAELWEDSNVDWWYAQNGLVFARDGALPGVEPTGPPLPLVHPLLLAHVAEYGPNDMPPEPQPGGLLRRLRGPSS